MLLWDDKRYHTVTLLWTSQIKQVHRQAIWVTGHCPQGKCENSTTIWSIIINIMFYTIIVVLSRPIARSFCTLSHRYHAQAVWYIGTEVLSVMHRGHECCTIHKQSFARQVAGIIHQYFTNIWYINHINNLVYQSQIIYYTSFMHRHSLERQWQMFYALVMHRESGHNLIHSQTKLFLTWVSIWGRLTHLAVSKWSFLQ